MGNLSIFNTDLGNAERFILLHGVNFRYCHAWKKWLHYNGKRWAIDDTGEIVRAVKDAVRDIYREAANVVDVDKSKALAKHALRSQSESRIRAMIELAKSEPGIPITPDKLDADPWLINCQNGTLNLRTGELKKHDREDLITRIIPVEYDMVAECPTWKKFLDKIFQGNRELVVYVQKVLGYSLTGSTTEQAIFFLYGTGANGKSTLIDVIMSLMADYSLQTPIETLMQSDRGNLSNDVARLKGARFVAAVEAGEGRKLAESLIKQLTGGDTISARFLHQEFFEFKPQCKIFLATNHRPVIQGSDHGIWRRIKLIPFNVSIPEAEQDKNLVDKLKGELPGIFAWMVRGCHGWQQLGMETPNEVKAAIADYQADMDVINGFLEECCIENPGYKVQSGKLYKSYVEWCRNSGEQAISKFQFSRRLKERGLTSAQGTGGFVYWAGVGLTQIVD